MKKYLKQALSGCLSLLLLCAVLAETPGLRAGAAYLENVKFIIAAEVGNYQGINNAVKLNLYLEGIDFLDAQIALHYDQQVLEPMQLDGSVLKPLDETLTENTAYYEQFTRVVIPSKSQTTGKKIIYFRPDGGSSSWKSMINTTSGSMFIPMFGGNGTTIHFDATNKTQIATIYFRFKDSHDENEFNAQTFRLEKTAKPDGKNYLIDNWCYSARLSQFDSAISNPNRYIPKDETIWPGDTQDRYTDASLTVEFDYPNINKPALQVQGALTHAKSHESLQIPNDRAKVLFTDENGLEINALVTPGADGLTSTYSAYMLPGTYTMQISKSGHTTQTITGVSVAYGAADNPIMTVNDMDLLAGDRNDDGKVTFLDAIHISRQPTVHSTDDDMSWVRLNFGKSAAQTILWDESMLKPTP